MIWLCTHLFEKIAFLLSMSTKADDKHFHHQTRKMDRRNLNTSEVLELVLEDGSDDDNDMHFQFEESNDEEDSDEDTDRHVLVGDLQCEETQVDDEVDLDLEKKLKHAKTWVGSKPVFLFQMIILEKLKA